MGCWVANLDGGAKSVSCTSTDTWIITRAVEAPLLLVVRKAMTLKTAK